MISSRAAVLLQVAVLVLTNAARANDTSEQAGASASAANVQDQSLELFGFSISPPMQLLLAFFIELCIVAVYHQFVAKGKPGDWFETHAFANFITVVFALPSIFVWFVRPSSVVAMSADNAPPTIFGPNWSDPEIMFHQNNNWAISFIVAVHTYHCLAFPLSKQDIFHHLMFVPTIGVYGAFFVDWGPVRNCVAFFISGLPGGIDYLVLTMVKRGHASKLFQKRLASKINLWCRGPFLGVLLPGTCYLGIVEGHVEDIGTCVKIAGVALLCCYNGIYYMEMAIRNYQLHLTTTKLTKLHELELSAKQDAYESRYYARKEEQSRQQPGVASATKSLVKIARALSMGKDLSTLDHTGGNAASGTKKDS